MKISQTMKIIILLLVLDIYCCFLAAGYVIFQDQHSSERLDTSYFSESPCHISIDTTDSADG